MALSCTYLAAFGAIVFGIALEFEFDSPWAGKVCFYDESRAFDLEQIQVGMYVMF